MTLPDGVTFRTAVVADAEAGARLHRDCWREAYGPITDLTALEEHLADEAGWAARWQAQIEAGFAPLLAVDAAGTPVGFARSGASRDEDVPDILELYALYVRAAWWGAGVGHALLGETIGDRAAYLWVLAGNRRAIAFYERQGFRLDGTEDDHDEGLHVRMVRA